MSAAPPPDTPPPPHYPHGGGRVGHRLHSAVIIAIIGVVILIAAAVTAAIVLSGKAERSKPPSILPGGHAAMAAAAGPGTARLPDPEAPVRTPVTMRLRLASAESIDIAEHIGHGRAGLDPGEPGAELGDAAKRRHQRPDVRRRQDH